MWNHQLLSVVLCMLDAVLHSLAISWSMHLHMCWGRLILWQSGGKETPYSSTTITPILQGQFQMVQFMRSIWHLLHLISVTVVITLVQLHYIQPLLGMCFWQIPARFPLLLKVSFCYTQCRGGLSLLLIRTWNVFQLLVIKSWFVFTLGCSFCKRKFYFKFFRDLVVSCVVHDFYVSFHKHSCTATLIFMQIQLETGLMNWTGV